MAIRGGKDGYIAKFLPGEKLLYSHFSGGKFYYIAIFPGGKMARGKNYYTTPDWSIRGPVYFSAEGSAAFVLELKS